MTANQKKLYAIASLQQGFFTAKQAITCGYIRTNHHKQVENGQWAREGRGIYRLAHYPPTEHPDLMYWYLWSSNREGEPQGVFSHETALSLFELGAVMPARIHVTVPTPFSRHHAFPKNLKIHRGNLTSGDITDFHGVRITTPIRTLIDVIEEEALSDDLILEALREGFSKGLIPSKRRLMHHPIVANNPVLMGKLMRYLDAAGV